MIFIFIYLSLISDPTDPYLWVKSYPSCLPQKDKLHSPIDLNDEAVRNDTVPALMFRGLTRSGTVKNVRDTVVVDFDECMTVSGGWLKYKYRLVQIRFHWGSKTTNGSEHTLNNRRFPMEMQLVGVAPGYKDVKSALNQQSGVAMIGVFIDIGPVNNVHFKAISDAVSKVPYPGTWEISICKKTTAVTLIKFFYYQGGLTTPPCSQTVDWIVLENPVLISSEQVRPCANAHSHCSEATPSAGQFRARHLKKQALLSALNKCGKIVIKCCQIFRHLFYHFM
uniref:carbonic anhydrase n=1 Tax=Astyanax mexicanus TaxID=7994 RepID=A0A8B9GYF9_ASTMX